MRVLLVTSRHPVPAWRGNQVRTMEWLEALSDCELLLVCPPPGRGSRGPASARVVHYPLSAVGRAVGLMRAFVSGAPLQEGLYDSSTARRTVAGAVREFSPDAIIIQMVRCGWAAEAALSVDPGLPIVFDAIDSMGLHFDRAAASAKPWTAPVFTAEAGRCRKRERRLSGMAGSTVAVAARDLAALGVPEGRGRVIPVAARDTGEDGGVTRGKTVLLSGNLGYRPSVLGAEWFARDVWPRVRTRVPDALWVLAGARPAAAVQRLSRLNGVEIHGDVPDLGAYLASSRLAVAPMSSGSGVPMKVLEAMAAGIPAVVHPWAADGLSDEAAGAVVVADGAEAWVEEIVRLLDDPQAAHDLGRKCRAAWRRAYHPDVVAQQIRDVVAEAAGGDVESLERSNV